MNVSQPVTPQPPAGPSSGPTDSQSAASPSQGVSSGVLRWVAVLFVFVGAMTIWGVWKLYQRTTAGTADSATVGATEQPEAGTPASDEPWIEEFTLTERSGKPFDSRELAGKVWVASFFFATCPSYCVQQNQRVQQLAQEYAGQDLTFVSITCDPKQDTPEKLREYARRFDADPQRWLFLTGDLTYIRRIGAEKFGVPVHEQTHKNSLILVDKWGKTRGSFDWNDEKDMKQFQETLTALLVESAPPDEVVPDSATPRSDPDDAESKADADAEGEKDDKGDGGVKPAAEGTPAAGGDTAAEGGSAAAEGPDGAAGQDATNGGDAP